MSKIKLPVRVVTRREPPSETFWVCAADQTMTAHRLEYVVECASLEEAKEIVDALNLNTPKRAAVVRAAIQWRRSIGWPEQPGCAKRLQRAVEALEKSVGVKR